MREYKIIRSDRKTVGIEISKELEVIVRAHHQVPEKFLDELVSQNEEWIVKHIEIRKKRNEAQTAYELAEEDAEELKALAKR
ncbi:MAG: DUF45 domain-containing protein [Clostridia bacterium]|nr:DUF45 domain-containing protein [Clostridia bacterium]